jgi:hypothetical protein
MADSEEEALACLATFQARVDATLTIVEASRAG